MAQKKENYLGPLYYHWCIIFRDGLHHLGKRNADYLFQKSIRPR